MNPVPVIAVFDIGKTNKKIFLFDQCYRILFERSAQISEIADEDGFPCEDLGSLRSFALDSLKEIFLLTEFKIEAVNFSAYGASLVYLDQKGNPVIPLYNYLKPFPQSLSEKFYDEYGGKETFSLLTASPALGSLNSGLQLYRVKEEKPALLKKIAFALHLPQYLSSLLTGKFLSDITSIGCHTALWNFKKSVYHDWIRQEKLDHLLAPIEKSTKTFPSVLAGCPCKVGIGLHDSSAALIPYLRNFSMPFVLISTGTWCISLNPFNKTALTSLELNSDSLCYLQYQGEPVKASRLHAGLEHERQVKRIAEFFNEDPAKLTDVSFQQELMEKLKPGLPESVRPEDGFIFGKRILSDFKTYPEAYHQLVSDLVVSQVYSTQLVLTGSFVKRIFVDGGFSNNSIFMNLLARAFPEFEVYGARMAQASALGAALAIHSAWNAQPVPNDLIELKYYSSGFSVTG